MVVSDDVQEVLRRIGRNLMLYQEIEMRIKFLWSSARLEGSLSELRSQTVGRQREVSKESMGQVAKRLTKDVLTRPDTPEEDQPLGTSTFRVQFTLTDDGSIEEEIANALAARNELVHHFLLRWNPASRDSTRKAMAWLDEKHRAAQSLQRTLRCAVECLQAAAAEMATPAFELRMEQTRLCATAWIETTIDLCLSHGDQVGWLSLSDIDRHLWQQHPDAMQNLEKRYGHSTLKQAMAASGMFEVRDLLVRGGGARTDIRVRPELERPDGRATVTSFLESFSTTERKETP